MSPSRGKIKYHKSCDYCRYRKVKCQLVPGESICAHCARCEIPCVFSRRGKSTKRLLRSAQLAAEVQRRERQRNGEYVEKVSTVSPSSTTDHDALKCLTMNLSVNHTLSMAIESIVSDGNRLLTLSSFSQIQAEEPAVNGLHKDFYTAFVQPYTPLICETLLSRLTPVARLCIVCYIANPPNWLDVLRDWLQMDGLSDPLNVSAVALLGTKHILPHELVSSIFAAYRHGPPLLTLPAVTVDAWMSLLTSSSPELHEISFPTDLSSLFPESLFCYHFFTLTLTLHRYLTLRQEVERDFSLNSPQFESWKKRALQLEYDLLLWPVKLPIDLSVVKDELIATDGALVLHILSNTVLILLYGHALSNPSSFGKLHCLQPVPGVLQFLSGMAKSSFINGPQVQEKWPNIYQCLALTARIMLNMYKEFDFEYAKIALSFWKDDQTDPTLYNDVQQALDHQDWSDDADGATVYWVYRDCRSMSLNLHLSEVGESL
jgi:hypothetical protein